MLARRLAIGIAATLLSACTFPFLSSPPVDYVSVTSVAGDRGVLHERAGIYFAISNLSGREIARFTVAFDLYDSGGVPLPQRGKNSFYTDVNASLASGRAGTFVTSLDSVFPRTPDSLSVSRFRLVWILFADGGSWSNPGTHVYEAAE